MDRKTVDEKMGELLRTLDGPETTKKLLDARFGNPLRLLLVYDEPLADLLASLLPIASDGPAEALFLLPRAIRRLHRWADQASKADNNLVPHYPALRVYYACGLAAFVRPNVEALASILLDSRWGFASFNLHPGACPGIQMPQERGPGVSIHLCKTLQESLEPYFPDKEEYELAFNIFEYLSCLLSSEKSNGERTGPLGRFAWSKSRSVLSRLISTGRFGRALLRAGFFDGSETSRNNLTKEYDAYVAGCIREGLEP
jgi:hypothetical protein